ncbi:MAG: molybdenum cofactor guanylyltransferase [Mariprofundus sp.]
MSMDNCTAVILTGGESRRMGSDKAAVLLHGKPLLQHVLEQLEPLFADIVISVREHRDGFTCPQIIDVSEGRGPMVGIQAALEQVQTPWIFVIGCDMPFVSAPLIAHLASKRSSHDAVVCYADDRPQPLFGFYATSCLPLMRTRIAQGKRSMIRLLETLDSYMLAELQVKAIDPQLKSLISLDSVADVKRMESKDE